MDHERPYFHTLDPAEEFAGPHRPSMSLTAPACPSPPQCVEPKPGVESQDLGELLSMWLVNKHFEI